MDDSIRLTKPILCRISFTWPLID